MNTYQVIVGGGGYMGGRVEAGCARDAVLEFWGWEHEEWTVDELDSEIKAGNYTFLTDLGTGERSVWDCYWR